MQFRFSGNKILFAVALLLSGAVPLLGSAAADNAAQAPVQTSEYDFTVGVTSKDHSHPHYDEGSKLGFVINGAQGRTLVLVRGKTYKFNVLTTPMHDFYVSKEPMGWGTSALTEGVTGNFTFKGIITFKPTAETPDIVYYACRNHKYMGGEIHIVNPGEEDKIKVVEAPAVASAVQVSHLALDKNEISQRLNFANMFIGNSEAAKRIATGNNQEAKTKYNDALNKLSAATIAFDAGDLHAAKASVDEAMSIMTEAAKLAPSDSMQKKAETRNEELLQGLTDLEASYKQNRDAIISEGGAKDIPKLDSDRIHQLMNTAQALSGQGKYEEANRVLSSATNEVSGMLNKLLANKTMAYEMKFTSPVKEYEYELDRFTSLEKLIPQAVEEKRPEQAMLSLMESYVAKAKEKRDQANENARQKNYMDAVENIKNGTEQLNTALRLIGVQ